MYNGHGDVTALVDGANTVQATYYYDAFGVHKEQTGTADNPYRYSGYTFDEESGLYYLNARFYDPELARFMQEDTYRGDSADPLSLNLYTYVSNNPLIYWDPTGHVKVGDNELTPAAQQKIVVLTDLYYATSDPKERKEIEKQADTIRSDPASKTTGNSAPASSSSKNTIPLADATQATQIITNALKQIEKNVKSGNKSITTTQWTTLTSQVSFGGVSAKSVNNVTGANIVQTTFAGTIVTTSYHKNTQMITFSTKKNTAFWTNPTIFGKQQRGEEWFTDPDLRVVAESQLLWELDPHNSIDMSAESPNKVHDKSNKVMLVQYLSGGPVTGSWDGNSYNALQDYAALAGLKWVDNSVDSALMRYLIASDAGRADWKRGDFIRKYGIADAVASLAMGMAIYQQANYRGNLWENEPKCFVAGTLIATADGSVAIEDIVENDLVYSANPDTDEKGLRKVVRTFVNETFELIHIHVNGEKIVTTPGHRFWLPQKGWTQAVQLRAGDKFLLQSDEIVIVEWVQREILESPVKVYNFEVEDWHTYFVGESAALVHNECTVINSGTSKAPNRSNPNSIYEQLNPDGSVRIRAFYDNTGNRFSRQDFNHAHFNKSTQQYIQPHEHNYSYNDNGQRNGRSDGPVPPGYNNIPNK
jgi:RHS repeat-associated protein